MDIELVKQLALGVVPPGIFALVLFGVLWRRGGSDESGRIGRAGSLAIGFGFVALSALIFSGVQLPPASADRWIAPMAAVFGIIGAVVSGAGGRAAARAMLVPTLALVAIVSAPWLGDARLAEAKSGQSALHSLLTIGGFVMLAMLTLRAVRTLHEKHSGSMPIAITAAWLGAASQIMVMAFDALKMGQAIGVFAAVLGGAMLIAFKRSRASLRWMLEAPVLTSAAAFFQGYVRGDSVERPWVYLVAVLAAPWLVLLADLGPMGRLKGWKAWAIRLALIGAPLGRALAMAKAANDAAMHGY